MKRGDIYYIEINDEGVTGHEMMKSRPGIIVSRDDHNEAAETVQVVYCSASQHRELPEHVCIRSTPRPSTAMCEHIYTVDKSRLGNFVGHLTPQEMQRLDIGIMVALDIGGGTEPENLRGGGTPAPTPEQRELERTRCELDTIRTMYERLLDRVMGRAG